MSSKAIRPMLSRRSIIAATAGLAASGAAGNYGQAQSAEQISPQDLPDAGPGLHALMPQPAPALKFTDAAGKPMSLGDFAGHALLVNLWATWCGPCVAELPSLAAAAPVLAKNGILVLPISLDFEGAQAVRPFYANHNIRGLPILLDPDGSALDVLNAAGIPATIIINRSGQLVSRLVGAANWSGPATIRKILQLAGTAAGGVMPV